MKATLSFDLNDPDDRQSHMRSVKALDMASVLWELSHNTGRKIENAIDNRESNPMTPEEVLELFTDELYSLLAAHNIDIDELY